MRKLFIACAASLLTYGLAFGFVLDRPLQLGFLQRQIEAKLALAASTAGPKLVILAGSNGPYSHRCEIIQVMLAMPCVNGGVAVGIGLDYLFARWRTQLRPGDVVYLPMEEEQFTRTQSATELGPDAEIMFRHDWKTLFRLSARRWLAAWFSFNLRTALMSPIEAIMLATHFHDPRAEVTGTTNAWGDHIGHTAALAEASRSIVTNATVNHASAQEIETGYGTGLIGGFIRWASTHSVRVVGGPPTEPSDAPIPAATEAAIRAVYRTNGAAFLELPNDARYPRSAFFDTVGHLNETWQIRHSVLVAEALGRQLHPPVMTDDAYLK
jgi:hypothetical protein